MTGEREFTGAECASLVGVTIKTWYAWIAAGAVRAAPIVRGGGPGRGGRRVRWLAEDVARGLEVRKFTREGGCLRDFTQSNPHANAGESG